MTTSDATTILLAHPDVAERGELRKLLRDQGFAVLESHDGGRTLDMVRRLRPELAIIDGRLEKPPCIDVVRRIIEGREALGTSVIVLDPTNDETKTATALSAGASDVCMGVTRPVELVARVRSRLNMVAPPPPRSIARSDGAVLTDVSRLVQSDGFVERLVDCSGDAIIASDRQGLILLFNRAAERITGYRAEEIVGEMNVVNIYPEGVAYDVMKKLRAADYGGVGKAGPLEAEILAQDGEGIPIHLHASLLYDGPEEIASVGFFSDLRARREIEAKLAEAQEQLISAEKQAAVTELAGTTAHELNQPLAGIMGYTELLQRKLPEDHPAHQTVVAIQEEVERMAAVVRKIGRITHYETQTYVGGARIVDLDRSSSKS